MKAFEVSHLRRIASFNQRFKNLPDQCGEPSAQNRLLSEEVGFGLFFESGLQHAAAGSANGFRPDSLIHLRVLSRSLDSDKSGHSLTLDKLSSHDMPALWEQP